MKMIKKIKREALRELYKRIKNPDLLRRIEILTQECDELRKSLTELKKYKTWAPPGHFYSPIPSLEYVKSEEEEIFSITKKIQAVNLNDQGQIEILEDIARLYPEIPFGDQKKEGLLYFFKNPAFSYGDAILLYSMIRRFEPQKVIEIGSGYSSCVMLDTDRMFLGSLTNFTFIDPFPKLLNSLISGNKQKVEIISDDLQKVPVEKFKQLEKNDILFVDSTHVSKINSDVNYIFFEILPALKSGVIIHIHDIFYPFEYPKQWVYEGRAWNEDYMLRAFLQYNDEFEILFFNDYMAKLHRDEMMKAAPLCLRSPGGSIWLRRK